MSQCDSCRHVDHTHTDKGKGEFKECETHPSPVRAQHAWMCHGCVVMELSVRHLEISAAVMEPFTSCLLARIRIDAFCRS